MSSSKATCVRRSVFFIAAVSEIVISIALGQSGTGSIQGVVVGDDGKPISGARVYAGTKTGSQQFKAPPTVVTMAGSAVTAGSDGSFSIPSLAPGLYVLCAQTTTAGWLDPCQWSATVPIVNVTSGQALSGQKVVMAKGSVLQIRINDPAKLLATSPNAVTQDVQVLALASNKSYYYARLASADANGRNHLLTLPFDAPHTLIIRSQQFTLADSKGAAVSANGHTEPVQTPRGTNAPVFTFTVTGKSN